MRLRNWISMLICVICSLAGYASFAPIPKALRDLNRGVESITYNDLNLPAVISCADGTVARNWYAADGRLLSREVRPKTARLTREAYLGDFIFNQNALQRLILKQINTPAGYMAADGGVYSFVRDYQGNVRQVVNERGGVVQESDYYPYGMLFGESDVSGDRSEANRYRYGGKEYLAASGLNLCDFTARYLDPAVGGFLSSDPMQGDYMPLSPTSYCGADPVNRVDPTGEDIFILHIGDNGLHMAMLIQDENGKWLYYSINGNNLVNPFTKEHSGGRPFNDVGVGAWDSPEEFLSSEYNVSKGKPGKVDKSINNYDYQEGFYIQTNSKQDAIMKSKFEEISETRYSILFNNCATAVQQVMIEAGIPVSKPTYKPIYNYISSQFGIVESFSGYKIECKISNIPSIAFKSIMKWNATGRYIHK